MNNAVLLERNVYECDYIPSPFVFGFIKPKIYIPFRMNEKEKRCILFHEQHHIKRLDHIFKPLSFLLLTIYWFNPLVWVAYLCMCKDMEMSCDEKVLSDMEMSVKNEERVKNVLHFQQSKAWVVLAAVILCIGAVVACASNPLDKSYDCQDIFGCYGFDENIYTNPLSSFYAFKEDMPYYKITENAMLIIDNRDGSIQERVAVSVFEKKSISMADFASLFSIDIAVPDISRYDERH